MKSNYQDRRGPQKIKGGGGPVGLQNTKNAKTNSRGPLTAKNVKVYLRVRDPEL